MRQKAKKISDFLYLEVSGDHTAKGSEALFYRLGKRKFGIKLYGSCPLAMSAFERQKLAASQGLAPKVGKFILAKKPNSPKLCYGYQTEKADEVSFKDDIFRKQSKGLLKRLKKLGLSGDFADVNCGVLRHKLVAVDFGSHSKSAPLGTKGKI